MHEATAGQNIGALLAEQRSAWRRGERPRVETFLERYPGLRSNTPGLLDLIYHELVLREDAGETPRAQEYERRFPALADELQRQFSLHATLGSNRIVRATVTARILGDLTAGIPDGATARDPAAEPASEEQPVAPPERLGRFVVGRRLDEGGFGEVFLGHDPELHRDVAIKIARHAVDAADESLTEARRMARLEHPAIVSVYDFGREGGRPYIVSQFIDGMSLAERVARDPLELEEAVRLVARMADALAYVHEKSLIHRDVKPANVLLDRTGDSYLADLGLAVTLEEAAANEEIVGTPQYMSPEQLRSEDHRVDARTDVYSLGVVLHELLTGRLPFDGASIAKLFEAILCEEPRSLRAWKPTVPPELDRICLRAFARRPSDRYSSAAELARDLRAFLDRDADAAEESVIVHPRGLRPFRAEDSAFFPHLLPGPRRPDGLPSSIDFWKRAIEDESGPRVGLIYGPSGCGKTSLLEAGILPRLGSHVLPIVVQATPQGTEVRLTEAVRSAAGALRGESLVDVVRALRAAGSPGRRFLLVIDQAEQWLHSHRHDLEVAELTAALRQIDGLHVRALLLIRDDYWVEATRVFRALEAPMVEGENAALVDLFGEGHARRVLELLGVAYGALPVDATEWTRPQRSFVEQAVAQLTESGKVVCVRLALLAEMLKDRPWVPATLDEIGGVGGVGVLFLEQAFGPTGVPERREVESEARSILERLLPVRGLDLKGRGRGVDELAGAAGLDESGSRLRHVVRVLEEDLHLISRVADTDGDAEVSYQLTHDYLVPALREWLLSKRRETWRGRARLALEERAEQWSRGRETRLLPSFPEHVLISVGVRRGLRKPLEHQLMRASLRRQLKRGGTIGLCAVVLVGALLSYRSAQRDEQAAVRVQAVVAASAEALPYAVDNLRQYGRRARDGLSAYLVDPEVTGVPRLRAACALAGLGDVHVESIVGSLTSVPALPVECANVVAALAGDVEDARRSLWDAFRTQTDSASSRVRYALVGLALGDARASMELLASSPDPTSRTDWIHTFPSWHASLEGYLWAFGVSPQSSSNDDLRSALALALGKVARSSMAATVESSVLQVLEETVTTSPDAGVRAAAQWALAQWGHATARKPHPAPEGASWFVNRYGMRFVELPPGSFFLGTPREEKSDSRRHRVTLTRRFYLADTETTLGLYRQFLEDPEWPDQDKPLDGACSERADVEISPHAAHPAQTVSWRGAVMFCNWLSTRDGRTPCYRREGERRATFNDAGGTPHDARWENWTWDAQANGYRLPTEAEWEYACRTGATTGYFFGDDSSKLPEYGLSTNDVRRPTHPVATLMPNRWGLFDVHGNVWEWVWDWYYAFPARAQVDPRGPAEPWPNVGPARVFKGGGVANSRGNPDAASRGRASPENCFWNVGFRVATFGD